MCIYFKIETDVAQNLIDFFSLILTVRGPFHRNDFKWKKHGYMGWISEKGHFCKKNLTKERKQPPVVTPQQANLYNLYSVACGYFWTMLIMVTEQLYWRKILYGCSRSLRLWALFAIMKRCAYDVGVTFRYFA